MGVQWFQSVDQDNSGQIDAAELGEALENGDMNKFSEEACRMMISMFDSNLTGTIDVNEFGQLFQYINQWKTVFEGYDKDRSGVIDKEEYSEALQQMGYRFSYELSKICLQNSIQGHVRCLWTIS